MSRREEAIRYYARNPIDFVEDVIGVKPDDNQRAILRSVEAEPMTSVRSGHGVGKSAVESWAIIWFLCTRPYPKVPCTAPTQHQLFDILWAEAAKWIRNTPALKKELIWTNEKIYMKGHPEEWFAAARTATNPDALQGFHAEHLLFIIDEASGVKDIVFEPVLGALSTEGAKLLMCGNPTRLTGFFYDSHHKNRASYNTLHVDGRMSARVNKGFIERISKMYGTDSDVFRVRVAGEFPKQEADVFIGLSAVEQSCMCDLSARAEIRRISFGVDVARYGDDETVIAQNVGGRITLPVMLRGQSLMTTVGKVVLLYRAVIAEYPQYKGDIYANIDDTGLGGGVTDRLEEVKREERLTRLVIVPVNAAGRVPDEVISYGQSKIKAHEIYDNLTSYLWGSVKEHLRKEDIALPSDDDLAAQLSCRKYRLTSKGKIQLESKEEMKKRNISSPDRADAVALSCYEGKEAFNITGLL
ncbi:MAG: terminase B [Lachnospiraceae bacterium]